MPMMGGMWNGDGRRRDGLARHFAVGLARAVSAVLTSVTAMGAVITAMPGGFERGAAVIVCAFVLAIILHELGHLLAARIVGSAVTAIYLGGPPVLATVRLGGIRLGLGVRPRGRVMLRQRPPAGRHAVFLAAGPLVNLLTAVVVLVLPGPRWLNWPAALIWAGMGLGNLVPLRARDGQPYDGAALLRLAGQHRADKDVRRLTASPGWLERADAADRLLAGYRRKAPAALGRFHVLAALLRAREQIDDLLELHAGEFRLSGPPSQDDVLGIHQLEWAVLTVPGLGEPAAGLAAERVEWVVRHCAAETLPAVQHTLALARLRQHRPAEVEPLCTDVLAASLTADQRATVLATVAMARHALGEDARTPLAEAVTLAPAADLVSEAGRLAGTASPQQRPSGTLA